MSELSPLTGTIAIDMTTMMIGVAVIAIDTATMVHIHIIGAVTAVGAADREDDDD